MKYVGELKNNMGRRKHGQKGKYSLQFEKTARNKDKQRSKHALKHPNDKK